MSIMSINNIAYNQASIAANASRAGSRSISDAAAALNSAPLLKLDLSGRQGYREDYSIEDAAESLWKQETQTFNLKDLEDPEKASEIIQNMRRQAQWDLGRIPEGGETKEEVMAAYVAGLRQNGLDGTVNWSGLSRELDAFKAATPEELEDGLNYLASRYVAVQDKLERNYQGDELAAQLSKLEEVYQAGKAGMIDGYTQLLQDNLGLSGSEAQGVRDSFSAILDEKVNAYRNALGQVSEAVSQTGPDSVWLQNHDAYIASQLRGVGTAGQSQASYSVQDLTAAGKVAKEYGTVKNDHDEARLALDLAMVDMKTETMISRGLVSENMAALLRSSRTQAHDKVLDAADQYLADRESTRLSVDPAGSFAPIDRALFQGIYNSVMNAYKSNGGDGAGAIRAGVSYGQTATAQAGKANPKVSRWGISMETYWKNFYATREPTALEKQCNRLMVQSGQTPTLGLSSYQQYESKWQNFLASIGSGMDLRA